MGNRVFRHPALRYISALILCGAVALSCLPLVDHLDLANIIMLFLLAVTLIAVYLGRGPAILAAFCSVALFDVLFVPPRFSFSVNDGQYLLTFGVMLVVALVISHLSTILQQQITVSQKQEQEIQMEKLRSSLLSALSHDIRTPLTALCGLADTLKLTQRDASNETLELIEALRAQALRLHNMVDNLLDMARLQSGNVLPNKEWQPVEEVIGASIHLLGSTLEAHPVKVSISPQLPLLAFDAVLMERVFCNLLENAAKYSPPQSAITVNAECKNNIACITIHNEGPGFPEQHSEQLFDMFERGRHEAGTPGFGMGLAICRSIMAAHGGNIRLCHPPQSGALVELTLPVGTPPGLHE